MVVLRQMLALLDAGADILGQIGLDKLTDLQAKSLVGRVESDFHYSLLRSIMAAP